jgi:ABC-type uncharacterized transport system permease subunit
MFFGQPAAAAQALDGAGQALGQGFEHGAAALQMPGFRAAERLLQGADMHFFAALSLVGLGMAALTTAFGASGRMPALGIVVFPLAAASLLAYRAYGHADNASGLGWRLQLHAWMALLAYATLALSAVLAIFLWAQERALRRREFRGWLRALPPLTELESLLFRSITVGFVLLTATLLTGLLFVDNLLAQHLVHKTVLSVLSWLAFGARAALLAVRHRADFAGQADLAETPARRARARRLRKLDSTPATPAGRPRFPARGCRRPRSRTRPGRRRITPPWRCRTASSMARRLPSRPDRHAPRIRQRRGIDQRLHLDQQRPRAFARHHHALPAAACRCRTGRSPTDSALRAGRLSDIANTPSSLTAPKRFLNARSTRNRLPASPSKYSTASTMCSSTRGPAMPPSLVTCPTRNTRYRSPWRSAPAAPRLAHLADRARRGGQRVGPQGLDRVDEQLRPGLRACSRTRSTQVSASACRPSSGRPRRTARPATWASDSSPVTYRPGKAGAIFGQRLQQQGRLADAGIAADQHHRARGQAAAEHAIELADAGRRAKDSPEGTPGARLKPCRRRLTAPPRQSRICGSAGIAQLVERVIRNDEVVGSIPISGTSCKRRSHPSGGFFVCAS